MTKRNNPGEAAGTPMKTIEVPWLIGDECWVLRPITTWSAPVQCAECDGAGEHKTKAGNIRQCPDCKGRKTISTPSTVYYTQWSRVSYIEARQFWHGTNAFSLSVICLFRGEDNGRPYMSGDAHAVGTPDQAFATEEAAIEYAKSKGWNVMPAVEGKRP